MSILHGDPAIANNPFIKEIFSTFVNRRVAPFQSFEFKTVTLIKHTKHFFSLSLMNDDSDLVASLIGQMGEWNGKAGVNDAVILFPHEPPEVFLDSNIRFAITPSDSLTYQPVFVGQRMKSVAKVNDKAIWESEDRTLLLADVIVNYLDGRANQRSRGIAFLNAILPRHVTALRWFMLTSRPDDLDHALRVLDEIKPLSILRHEGTLATINTAVLKEYVSVVISAREQSSSANDAAQRRLIERDKAFLRQI